MADISVIIPAYNRAKLIVETLRSLLNQTVPAKEIIIIDDGSKDGTAEAVLEMLKCGETEKLKVSGGKPWPELKVIKQENAGPGAARNYALQFARGDWVLYLDADDLIWPNFLIQMIDFSKKNPDFSIISTPWRIFNDNGYISQPITHEVYGKSKNDLLIYSFARVPWHIGSALIKKSLLNQSSWVESMDNLIAEDGVFWFQLIIHARVGWSDIDGALYRIGLPHSRGNSSDSLKWAVAIQETVVLNSKILKRNGIEPNYQQCLACLDIFEDRYWISYRKNAIEAADICMNNAIKWLKKIDGLKISILLRKTIGIKYSIIIEKIFRRLFNKTKNDRVLVFTTKCDSLPKD